MDDTTPLSEVPAEDIPTRFAIESIADPQWSDEAQTSIVCMVKFAGFSQPIEFNATPDDPFDHGREVLATAIARGGITPYQAPSLPPGITQKIDIALRMTDAEGDILDAAFLQAPGKLKFVWQTSSDVDHASPYFQTLHDFIAGALTQAGLDPARADALLAPST